MINSNINFNKEIFVFITRGFTGEKFWKKINVNYDKNMEKLWEEFIVETNFENLPSPGFYIGKKKENPVHLIIRNLVFLMEKTKYGKV